ncbi:MAG: hypothetical protein ACRERC_26590, partial [Candidatus Binatia bacterium]
NRSRGRPAYPEAENTGQAYRIKAETGTFAQRSAPRKTLENPIVEPETANRSLLPPQFVPFIFPMPRKAPR